MLEFPEAYTFAQQIRENLVGKIISYIEVLQTPHRFAFFKGDVDSYDDMLEGQKIGGATNHGGTIQIDLEDSMIAFADGAYPRYFEDSKKFPKKHQFAIHFDDDTALFVSIQMYGEVFVFPKGECTDGYYISSSSKPNPLSDEFTFAYFQSLFQSVNKRMSAKAFLATEQRVPGLGNGVLQDILWDAGIDPRCYITEADLEPLYHSMRKILKQMVEAGGRDTEKTLFSEKGSYITQLSKNSLHQPCMKCGNEIHKANYMGGTVYFCEHCQRR